MKLYNASKMSSSRKEKAMSSLRALTRRVPLKSLPQLQPILLLQTVVGLSQTLNGSAAQLEALARALILDGQQRLCRLRDAAPHLHLPLAQLLEMIRSKDDNREGLSEEESAVQAMLEMCLGLMLQWLSRRTYRSYPATSCIACRLLIPFDALLPFCRPALLLPLRVRACPIF
jgi:hypothetical protein